MGIVSTAKNVYKISGNVSKALGSKDGKITDLLNKETRGAVLATGMEAAGTAGGAAIGSIIPVVGTAIGGMVGGYLGGKLYDGIMTNEDDKVDDKSFKEYSNKLFSSNNDLKDISQSFNKALGNDLLSDDIKGDSKTQFIANSLKYLENANVDDKTKNGILNGFKNITNETGQKQDDAILKTAELVVNNQIANDPNTKNLPKKELEQLKEKSIKDMTQNVINNKDENTTNKKNEKEESELDKLNKMANLTNSNPVEIIMDVLKKEVQKLVDAYNNNEDTKEKENKPKPKNPENLNFPSK